MDSGYSFEALLSKKKYLQLQGLDDQELWRQYLEENDDVLGYIYIVHVKMLFRFGRQFLQDRELLKDCIQDLFINLKKTKDASVKVTSIKSYLFKALYRNIQHTLKIDSRFVKGEDFRLDTAMADQVSVEMKWAGEEESASLKNRVSEALNKLSAKQKHVIIHYYYDGFTYEEIAGIMGLSDKSSARKLLHRALDGLRNLILLVLSLFFFYFSD